MAPLTHQSDLHTFLLHFVSIKAPFTHEYQPQKTPYQELLQPPAMKMSLKRLPILHRLASKSSNLLRISILLTKTKKPTIHKLIFLKKSRKLKRFKLVKHYNYGEYQFVSPSSTPLIHYYNGKHELENRSIQDIYSMLFWCKCFGAREEADCRLGLETDHQPALMALAGEIDLEDDDSVDERAERFIQKFYAEMRLQRQESF